MNCSSASRPPPAGLRRSARVVERRHRAACMKSITRTAPVSVVKISLQDLKRPSAIAPRHLAHRVPYGQISQRPCSSLPEERSRSTPPNQVRGRPQPNRIDPFRPTSAAVPQICRSTRNLRSSQAAPFRIRGLPKPDDTSLARPIHFHHAYRRAPMTRARQDSGSPRIQAEQRCRYERIPPHRSRGCPIKCVGG